MNTRDAAKIMGVRLAQGARREAFEELVYQGCIRAHYAEQSAVMVAVAFPMVAETWARSGLPAITVSHKLAGMMADAVTSPVAAEDLRMPWPAFMIDVPQGFGLQADWVIVRQGSIAALGGEDRPTDISFFGMWSHNNRATFGSASSLVELAERTKDGAEGVVIETADMRELDTESQRAHIALVRLIMSVIVELNRKSIREKIAAGPPKPNQIAMKRGEPKVWSFQITRDVVIDARPAVKAFIDGVTSRKVGVQTLVRGHYKRQPYGPRGELRRWIFVEAHWRGPEDAPIAARSHILD